VVYQSGSAFFSLFSPVPVARELQSLGTAERASWGSPVFFFFFLFFSFFFFFLPSPVPARLPGSLAVNRAATSSPRRTSFPEQTYTFFFFFFFPGLCQGLGLLFDTCAKKREQRMWPEPPPFFFLFFFWPVPTDVSGDLPFPLRLRLLFLLFS